MGASLLVGGVDFSGPQLYSVHPHGSYSRLPFTALGERFSPFPARPGPAALASRSSRDWVATTDLTSDASPARRFRPGRRAGGPGGSVPAEHDSEQHLSVPHYVFTDGKRTRELG